MNYKEMILREIKRLSEVQVKTLEEAIKIEQEINALAPRNMELITSLISDIRQKDSVRY
jgi:hypothetical protein